MFEMRRIPQFENRPEGECMSWALCGEIMPMMRPRICCRTNSLPAKLEQIYSDGHILGISFSLTL